MNRVVIEGWDERLAGGYLVIGVRSRVRSSPFASDCVEATSSLVTIEHQAGGYSCLHDEVTGVVLRLADAHALAHKPLVPLLNGLIAIGESPGIIEGPLDQRFGAFGFTWGDSIDARRVGELVGEYLPVPSFDEGVEAFVSGPLDEPRFFARWPVWHPELGLQRIDETVCDHLVAAVALSGRPLRVFLLWENSD